MEAEQAAKGALDKLVSDIINHMEATGKKIEKEVF